MTVSVSQRGWTLAIIATNHRSNNTDILLPLFLGNVPYDCTGQQPLFVSFSQLGLSVLIWRKRPLSDSAWTVYWSVCNCTLILIISRSALSGMQRLGGNMRTHSTKMKRTKLNQAFAWRFINLYVLMCSAKPPPSFLSSNKSVQGSFWTRGLPAVKGTNQSENRVADGKKIGSRWGFLARIWRLPYKALHSVLRSL